MQQWMTIRVVLVGRPGQPLAQPPGRVLLAAADHLLVDLADVLDTAFGRWDLGPAHRFEIDGRRLGAPEEDDGAEEGSDEVTLAEAGLRQGVRFRYVFDLEEMWLHDCTVEAVGVDPADLLDDEDPDGPLAVDGWGSLPDQYGRRSEQDDEDGPDEDDEDDEDDDDEWAAAAAACRAVVVRALAGVRDEPAPPDLPAVVAALREQGGGHAEPDAAALDVLLAAADLDEDDVPDDDEELWTLLAAAVVAPVDDVPLDDDAVAAWTALEPADWAGAVIELVRSGPGTPADPEALLDLVARCPEVDSAELGEEDEALVLDGFEVVAALWRPLGVVDDEGALTPLGAWGLPRALDVAWAPAGER